MLQVVKIAHVAVTGLLPWTAFRLAAALGAAWAAACMAAILTASCLSLNVLGTHPFINTFTSTFVLLALSHVVAAVRAHIAARDAGGHECGTTDNEAHLCDHDMAAMSSDINANVIKVTEQLHNENVLEQRHAGTLDLNIYRRNIVDLTYGFILAICIYIRLDGIILIFATLSILTRHLRIPTLLTTALSLRFLALGGAVGLCVGGFVDHVHYGAWFLSPVQWFTFNVLRGESGRVFGAAPTTHYLTQLARLDALVPVSAVALTAWIIQQLVTCRQTRDCSAGTQHTEATVNSVCIFLAVFTFYSCHSHKELRFLYSCLVIMCIAVACAIHSLYKTLSKYASNQNDTKYCKLFMYLFVVLFVSSQLYEFCTMSDSEKSKWSYSGRSDSGEVNACLEFIGHQGDVSGVFIDRPLHLTGGYSIIRQNVPIFALNKNEFMEFSRDHTMVDDAEGVHVFGRIRDFVSVYNTPYLYRRLVHGRNYNYLVLAADREFEGQGGFSRVFEAGSSIVLRRLNDAEAEARLETLAARIPLGTNATVLEYEGRWLSHFGVYERAVERLLYSNFLDPRRPGPYRALVDVYRRTHRPGALEKVLAACTGFFPVEDCLAPYRAIELHPEYYRSPVHYVK